MPRDKACETGDLFVRYLGNGPQRALMLHCGLGVSGMWKKIVAPLEDRLSAVAPDLPGHGRSPSFTHGFDVHDEATRAVEPLFESGMHLVGHSFGATIALRLALSAPGCVASLTLIEPVFFAAAEGLPEFAPHRAEEEGFFEVYNSGDTRAAAECFNRIWGGGMPWEAFSDQVKDEMARQMDFVAATEPSLWQDCHGMLEGGRLEALTCPVTLMRGAVTVPIISAVHRGLLTRLPNANERVVGGAGHMLVLTHPREIVGAVQAHLDAA